MKTLKIKNKNKIYETKFFELIITKDSIVEYEICGTIKIYLQDILELLNENQLDFDISTKNNILYKGVCSLSFITETKFFSFCKRYKFKLKIEKFEKL